MKIIHLKRELEKWPNHAQISIGGVEIESIETARTGNTVDFVPIPPQTSNPEPQTSTDNSL